MAPTGRLTTPPSEPGAALPAELLGGLVERAARPDFDAFQAQLRSSGHCARPVRLRGQIETCDGHGQRRIWSTTSEPDGILRKACGNRREAVCGPCAERYRGDAYHLIGAGLRGGKGVPDTVTDHPAVFVTLTAPSFGAVHTRPLGRDGQPKRCRPRRDAPVCAHGVRLSCAAVHAEDDPCLGEPFCADCFDYQGAVVWNNLLGELWRRTGSIYLPRVLARQLGITQKHARELVRVAYIKVAEYQQRGLVHLHVLARLDRAMPDYRAEQLRSPDPRFTTQLLEDALRETVADVTAPVPDELGGGRVGWGTQFDVRALSVAERREVAGYLAKYATKSTEQAGGLLHRVTQDDVDRAPVREHVRNYLRHAFTLDTMARAATAAERAMADARAAPVGPAAEPADNANLLARRARHAMSTDERVSLRLRDQAGEHTGRIRACTSTPPAGAEILDASTAGGPPADTDHGPWLTIDSGAVIDLADVAVIATAAYLPPQAGRDTRDRRLAACAHAFGYRGHCLTKSRRYSTTFKALREARERHVHEQILARTHDLSQHPLAETAAHDRVAAFRFVGQGHLTTADAYLAASAAARAREHRRLAREEGPIGDRQTKTTRKAGPR